jgi:uncharacterized membrane protein YkvA (DUF1232 family)
MVNAHHSTLPFETEAFMAHQKYGYEDEYSEKTFWDKVFACAKTSAGREVIEKALWLYYTAQNPTTSATAKSIIYGALGYFIFPVDAISDATPVVGYADDLGVLVATATTVAMRITAEIKKKAALQLKDWFGS